jgi:alpha-L-fucosidase
MVKNFGGTYVCLTSKHHDGYCMFDTKTTNNNSVKTGPMMDVLRLFVDSARRHGLKVGIYYSWMEFLHKPTIEYFNTIVEPQIDELLRYNADKYFFDGDWELTTKYTNNAIANICDKIHRLNPNAKINDRLGKSKETKELYNDYNYLGKSDYRTYGDREIPSITPNIKWEHITIIGNSWGINKYQEPIDYKTGSQLYEIYNQVKNKGGDFLINFGPDYDGTLDPLEVKSILEFTDIINNT